MKWDITSVELFEAEVLAWGTLESELLPSLQGSVFKSSVWEHVFSPELMIPAPSGWRILALVRYSSFGDKATMGRCPEYDRLYGEVENVLGNLAQTTTFLLEVFRSKDLNAVHRLDKELELTVGEKERRIGALRQHIQEHRCVSPGNAESGAPPTIKAIAHRT